MTTAIHSCRNEHARVRALVWLCRSESEDMWKAWGFSSVCGNSSGWAMMMAGVKRWDLMRGFQLGRDGGWWWWLVARHLPRFRGSVRALIWLSQLESEDKWRVGGFQVVVAARVGDLRRLKGFHFGCDGGWWVGSWLNECPDLKAKTVQMVGD
ncbi:hypothetical protein GQ457_15G020550 [Hibiscus cannabinus]